MEIPPSRKVRIDRPATAARDVPAYLDLGGWGDGPGWLRKGAQIWLTFAEGEVVHYLSGPRPPVPGEIRVGGTIHRKDLDALLDVDPDTGRETIDDLIAAYGPSIRRAKAAGTDRHPHDGSRPMPPTFKHPGPLPEPIKLEGEGPSASDIVLGDRDEGQS